MTGPASRPRFGWRRAAAALLGLFIGGCALLVPPTRVPMDVLRLNGPCAARAPVLLVLLPGVYSRPQEFVDEGFVEAVRTRGIAADVWVTDAHLGYYNDRSVLTRLREDIVLPARSLGYRQIWLVGISLGGFGSLGYGVRHEAEIDGIVVLAPYLGTRGLMDEIAAAGGPAAWRAKSPVMGETDVDREFWAWLAGPAPRLPVYLGYGRDDRFADTNAVLATLLPADRVATTPGGHEWSAWRRLWQGWLDRRLLPTTCDAPPP